ncbi:MAG: hypothetical protein U5K69_18130 [Balneolaceae bacterium]|nr:hypothetical protein [Balneolaceae bacterium]
MIYFNNPFGGITYYPQSWSYYIVGFVLLFFIYFLVSSYQKNRISLLRTSVSFLGFSLLLLISALLTWYGWKFIQSTVFPQYQWLLHGETYARSWYLWLFLLFATFIATAVLRWMDTRINTNNLLGGIYLTWFTLIIALTVLLPAANYFLLWPAFFGLLGWAFAADSLRERSHRHFLNYLVVAQLVYRPFHVSILHQADTGCTYYSDAFGKCGALSAYVWSFVALGRSDHCG